MDKLDQTYSRFFDCVSQYTTQYYSDACPHLLNAAEATTELRSFYRQLLEELVYADPDDDRVARINLAILSLVGQIKDIGVSLVDSSNTTL